MSQPAKIDLRQELAPFGLKVETFGLRTRISVSEDPTKQQRDLLRQFMTFLMSGLRFARSLHHDGLDYPTDPQPAVSTVYPRGA